MHFNLPHKLAPADGKLKCPHCGNYANGYTSTENPDDVPKDNDISICLYCASVNCYKLVSGRGVDNAEPYMTVVAMTDKEISALPKEMFFKVLDAVKAVKKPLIINQ